MEVARAARRPARRAVPGPVPVWGARRAVCARCRAALTPPPAAPPPPGIDVVGRGVRVRGRRARARRAREVPQRRVRRSRGWVPRSRSSCRARADASTIVTWVPASRARRLGSGVDHGELLARAVARELRLPVAGAAPPRARARRRPARRVPNAGAVPASARSVRSPDATVLVVDDVATTGGTLRRGAAMLRSGRRARRSRRVAAHRPTRDAAPYPDTR